ncbi:hypothetical protein Tco_1508690 [Tanacetum coccineum]
MTRSTVKKLKEPLEEHEREMHRLRRAASRQQRNNSLAIAGRNIFADEASSSNNSGPKPTPPLKSLWEHLSPNSAADGAMMDASRLRFFHFTLKGEAKKCQLNEDEGWNRIEETVEESSRLALLSHNADQEKDIKEPIPHLRHLSGITTYGPPYPTPSTVNNNDRIIEDGGLEGEETTAFQRKETP